MEAKINEKALEYMDKEGIPFKVLKDGTVQVDMYYIKKGQYDDLISILETGTYPGENLEPKEVDRFVTEVYYDKTFRKRWDEDIDGEWKYGKATRVHLMYDAWFEHEIPKAELVTKDTPEEKLHDLIVIDDNDLPGWARSNNKAQVTHADKPTMNQIEE